MFNNVITLYANRCVERKFSCPRGGRKKPAENSSISWFPKPWISLRLVSGPIGQPEQSLGINLF